MTPNQRKRIKWFLLAATLYAWLLAGYGLHAAGTNVVGRNLQLTNGFYIGDGRSLSNIPAHGLRITNGFSAGFLLKSQDGTNFYWAVDGGGSASDTALSNHVNNVVSSQQSTNALFSQALAALASSNTLWQTRFNDQATSNSAFSAAIVLKLNASVTNAGVSATVTNPSLTIVNGLVTAASSLGEPAGGGGGSVVTGYVTIASMVDWASRAAYGPTTNNIMAAFPYQVLTASNANHGILGVAYTNALQSLYLASEFHTLPGATNFHARSFEFVVNTSTLGTTTNNNNFKIMSPASVVYWVSNAVSSTVLTDETYYLSNVVFETGVWKVWDEMFSGFSQSNIVRRVRVQYQ